jgi:hypothetical protein
MGLNFDRTITDKFLLANSDVNGFNLIFVRTITDKFLSVNSAMILVFFGEFSKQKKILI